MVNDCHTSSAPAFPRLCRQLCEAICEHAGYQGGAQAGWHGGHLEQQAEDALLLRLLSTHRVVAVPKRLSVIHRLAALCPFLPVCGLMFGLVE